MASVLQALAAGVYRVAAQVSAGLLRGHEIVESIYLHRSAATGEVSFGRSDIDLLIVVRQPQSESADGAELASLCRRVRLIRRLNPALSHVIVFDSGSFERAFRIDTHLGSLERRSVILLAGRPAAMPCVPVTQPDAVRFFSGLPSTFFSTVVRQRNHRDLYKLATDMWSAWAVARGLFPEPDLTRRGARARAVSEEGGAGLADLARDPERAPEFAFGLARRLHDELLPSLEPLREPLVFRAPLPPGHRERVFVVLPHAGFPLPAAAFQEGSFLGTPESLHLFAHYAVPFLDWNLPLELRRLGFLRPTPEEYGRACRFFEQGQMIRLPGFFYDDTSFPITSVALSAHCIPYLRNGEIPPPPPAEALTALLTHGTSWSEYYRREFGRVYWQSEEHFRVLGELAGRLE